MPLSPGLLQPVSQFSILFMDFHGKEWKFHGKTWKKMENNEFHARDGMLEMEYDGFPYISSL